MVAFSAVFFVAFVYIVARGALDWGPLQLGRPLSGDMVTAERTSTSTIRRASNVRRVGMDGRDDEQAA
jgi:hypothetical protein